MENVIAEVAKERESQKSRVYGGVPVAEFDKANRQGDWIAYIVRYASGVHPKLETRKDKNDFRTAMIKVAALAVAAVENYDKGYAQD